MGRSEIKPIEHRLSVRGHELYALELNPGSTKPPIILLHGIAVSIYSFKAMPKFFTELGHCFALTLPGHYPAKFPNNFSKENLTADVLAEIIAEAIQMLVGSQKFKLFGVSTGAFCALLIAARMPDRVESIISVSGFAKGSWKGFLGFHQWLVRRGPLGRAFFKWGYRLVMPKKIFPLLWLAACANRKSFQAYTERQAFLDNTLHGYKNLDLDQLSYYYARLPDIDMTSELKKIRAKTLILMGDEDPFIPFEQALILATEIPKAELRVSKGCGHLLFAEDQRNFERTVEAFLKS